MIAQKTHNIEEKAAHEEKTQGGPGEKDRGATWILICWFCLLLGFILLYWFTRL